MTNSVEDKLLAAQNLVDSSRVEDAIEKYQEVLSLAPEQLDALMGLGNSYLQLGDIKSAFEQFEKGRDLRPAAVDFAYQYALCLVKGGYKKEGLVELQRATGLCGDNPFFCTEIARLLVQLGEARGALGLLERLQELTPDDQIIMAKALGLQNRWAESIQLLHRLRTELPQAAILASELSMAAAQARDYRLAVANFEEYLTLVSPSASDYLRFADLLLFAKQSARAEQALKQVKDANDVSDDIISQWHFLSAKVFRLKGDYDKAIEHCEASLKIMPANAYAWASLIELCDASKLADHVSQIETLDGNEAFAQLHQRAQANFAIAQAYDRVADFKNSTQALVKANDLVAERLSLKDQTYKPSDYEQKAAQIIQKFPHPLFEKPGARTKAVEGNPIFIVGMPRSGTTLIEAILSQHKLVVTGGEQEAVPILIDEYWRQQQQGALPRLDELTQDHWNNMAGACIGRYTCAVNGIYTDKLPHNFENIGFIIKMFPQARIIQVHRDPRDIAISVYKKPFSDSHAYACNIEHALHQCEQAEKIMSHWSLINSNQIMDVNYSELVKNPKYYAAQIFGFCGLEWDDDYLEIDQASYESFTFSELQVRKKIHQQSIGAWKNYASLF